MKKAVLHFFFPIRLEVCVFLFALAILHLRSSASSADTSVSSSLSNNVHICEVLDYDMRARDSLYAATKQALNLNVGEPRTVRMIYFLPNDRPFQQAVVDSMKVTIRQVQTFFADQMEAHGYGRKTFRFETDVEGGPVVHRVDGQHPDSYYRDDTLTTVFGEVQQVFDFSANIYLVVVDNETGYIGRGNGRQAKGVANSRIRDALIPDGFHWTTAAHEIGHTFGLRHDFRDEAYIMSYGKSRRRSLSACHAEFLSIENHFNTDNEDKNTSRPTIELISPTAYTYPTGSTNIFVQLRASDSDGLHQVLLFTGGSLKACRGLNGERKAVVQFDYDGLVPSPSDPQGTGTSLSDPLVHRIYVEAVDFFGNARSTPSLKLVDISTQRNLLATLEGHTGSVYSVTFSPDGTILASGSWDNTVRLWDVVTQTSIATLYMNRVNSVTFSPDGTMLASGGEWGGDGIVKLWNVAKPGINVSIFEGHTRRVNSVAFSPDGTMLVSGSWDNTVRLWDVATRTNIATFKGHTRRVNSVAFSPDGTMLVSGSSDQTVKLWDVATRAEVATFETDTSSVNSVAFSPDGTMLASGGEWGGDGIVKLWDVATRAEVATFEIDTGSVNSLVFSPDGTLLAYRSTLGTVKLLGVATGAEVATFEAQRYGVLSVAFSPDGTTLASGIGGGAISFWDVSRYVTPVVYMPDANLRAVIRDALGKSRFAPITTTDMASLTTLDASNRNIRDLTGLEFATNLTELNLMDNRLSSLSVTAHIPALQDRGVEVLFDKTPTPDFDGDGVVGFADFLLFVAQFGSSEDDEGYDVWFDLDGDGVIGFGDFLIFVNAFGKKVS